MHRRPVPQEIPGTERRRHRQRIRHTSVRIRHASRVGAGDRADATRRFLELAKAQDKEFDNLEGKRVRWALVSIDTLDDLGDGQMRDVEVHSTMNDVDPPDSSMSLETKFSPEKFEPGRSGITGW